MRNAIKEAERYDGKWVIETNDDKTFKFSVVENQVNVKIFIVNNNPLLPLQSR